MSAPFRFLFLVLPVTLVGCGTTVSSERSWEQDVQPVDSEGCTDCLVPSITLCPSGNASWAPSDAIYGSRYRILGDQIEFRGGDGDLFPGLMFDGDNLIGGNGVLWFPTDLGPAC